jgi:hypothetical protein
VKFEEVRGMSDLSSNSSPSNLVFDTKDVITDINQVTL